MGWKYEAVPFRWEERNDVLFSGKCDCIWSGFTKEGREESYLWSIAYSYNTQGILVAADSGITELSDLRGKTVGVQSGTSSADILAGEKAELASGFGELKMYETSLQAFDDLKAGVIDAAAMDMTAGAYMVAGETEGGK
jgi:polar amino acid transport system substrate-binding protein